MNKKKFIYDLYNNTPESLKNIFNDSNGIVNACIFSRGYNQDEYSSNEYIEKIKNRDNTIIITIKQAIEIIKYSDIQIHTGSSNYYQSSDYLQKNNGSETLLFLEGQSINILNNNHKYVNLNYFNYPNDNIIDENLINRMSTYNYFYSVVRLLVYMGIKNIFLFGFYTIEKQFDQTNYNYYDDLVQKKYHYNEISIRPFEIGNFQELINLYFAQKDFLDKVNIYNVSKYGVVPNIIKRIQFPFFDIKTNPVIENQKIENPYTDLITQVNNLFD